MKEKHFVAGFAMLAFSTLVLNAYGADDNGSSNSSPESSTAQSSTAKSTTESSTKIVAGGDLQDGIHKLEEKNHPNGYRAVFKMTIKDGKITEPKYDNINENGESKTKDAEYNKNMEAKSGTNPKKYIPESNDQLLRA